MSLGRSAEVFIETFGAHFLTKDVLDFWKGWLETRENSFIERLLTRLCDVFKQLMGIKASPTYAKIALEFNRPLVNVLGNCMRSWFSLANTCAELITNKLGLEKLETFSELVDVDHYRVGVFLSNIVSPISIGESQILYSHISSFIRGKQEKPSPFFQRQLVCLLTTLRSLKTKADPLHSYKESSSDDAMYHWKGIAISNNPIVPDPFSTEKLKYFPKVSTEYSDIPLERLFSELNDSILCGLEPSLSQILPGVGVAALANRPDLLEKVIRDIEIRYPDFLKVKGLSGNLEPYHYAFYNHIKLNCKDMFGIGKANKWSTLIDTELSQPDEQEKKGDSK
jgi:hypothetical protein